jgi:ABC-2 type transport system permease protein
MSPKKSFSTANRVLRQLSRDPVTLGLIFIIPPLLIIILRFAFQSRLATFNSFAPMMQGIFPLMIMFSVASVATLRERSAGTFDRLMSMPISKVDLIFGYALAFGLVALLQALLTSGILLGLLDVPVLGGSLPLIAGGVSAALLGSALGLFVSSFARSEFQAIQFMPAVVLPQFLVCGFFISRDLMAQPLQWFADAMPLTYSVDAMKQTTLHRGWSNRISWDLLIVFCSATLVLMLGALTIRRQE